MAKKVTIYTTPTCSFCHLAKEYFKQKKVSYTEVNVQTDLKGREEMVKKSGGLGVPVIDIGGTIIIGFNKPAVEKALA